MIIWKQPYDTTAAQKLQQGNRRNDYCTAVECVRRRGFITGGMCGAVRTYHNRGSSYIIQRIKRTQQPNMAITYLQTCFDVARTYFGVTTAVRAA